MSNVNIIVDTKLQPFNSLHISIKHNRFTNNEENKSKEQAHLILVLVAVLSNDGSDEHVHMCRSTCQSLRCSYTQIKDVDEDQILER